MRALVDVGGRILAKASLLSLLSALLGEAMIVYGLTSLYADLVAPWRTELAIQAAVGLFVYIAVDTRSWKTGGIVHYTTLLFGCAVLFSLAALIGAMAPAPQVGWWLVGAGGLLVVPELVEFARS